jgi:HEPN domain-containing protein
MDEIFDKDEELRKWLSIAKEDLEVAKFLAEKYHPKPIEKICNFCQQSAEKNLKAYIFINDIEFPKTHDLSVLLGMCADINTEFVKFDRQCRYLTQFAIIPKYPHTLQINEDDATSAIRFAEEIKEFVINITHN